MSKRRREQQELARQRRRGRWPTVAMVLALAFIVVAVWLVNSDMSPLRVASGSGLTLAAHRPTDLHALAVSATDERTLTFGYHMGMLISRDGGATWSAPAGAAGKDAMSVALAPSSTYAYAAGHDAFLRSDDGGQSWSATRPPLPGTDIHGFTASATEPNTFYAYVLGSGLFKSTDGGTTWALLSQPPGSTMSLAAAKSGSGEMLYASTMEGMARSVDGGRTWAAMGDVPAGSITAAGETVYVADRGTVLASIDGGRSWQRRNFPRSAGLIAVAPTNPNLVYVVTDAREVWRSSDAGATWARVG